MAVQNEKFRIGEWQNSKNEIKIRIFSQRNNHQWDAFPVNDGTGRFHKIRKNLSVFGRIF